MPKLTTKDLDFDASIMLCDSVASAEGKLYIQGGGWETLNFQSYPAIAPRIGLAIVVTIPYGRTNQMHKLTIRLRNEDGEDVVLGVQPADLSDPAGVMKAMHEIEATFNAGRPPLMQGGETQVMPFALNLDGLTIPAPSVYDFVVEIDGEEVDRVKFRAMPTPMQLSQGLR